MPTVQAYGGRKVAQDALPGARKTGPAAAVETVDSLGGGIGVALSAAAHTGGQVAAAIQQDERQKANQTAALTYTRQLNELDHALVYDQTTGALSVTGKDTLPLHKTVLEAFDTHAATISDTLTNDEQRADFARVRDAHRAQNGQTIDGHTRQQMTIYQQDEAKSLLASTIEVARTNASDPAGTPVGTGLRNINLQIAQQAKIVEENAAALGVLGPEAKAALVEQVRNQTWEAVITQSLAEGKDHQAQVYLEEASAAHQFTGPQMTRMTDAVKDATTAAAGERSADQIFKELGPAAGDDQAPLSTDKMEARARELYPDDARKREATIAALRSRAAGVEAGRKQRLDVSDSAIWGGIAQGGRVEQIRRLPAFIAADGKTRLQVEDYYKNEASREEARQNARENRLYAADARAFTAEQRAEKTLELNSYSTYQELTTPQRLRTLTRGDILKQLPVLGQANTTRLLDEWERRGKDDAALNKLEIDTDMFKEIASGAGLSYVYKGSGTGSTAMTKVEKANYAKLKEAVDAEVQQRSLSKTLPLTPDEQRSAMQSVIDKKVLLTHNWFFADTPAIASLVKLSTDRARAYVPISQVPAGGPESQAYANYIRGEVPATANWSDQSIRDNYGLRFERAYALHLMGAPSTEIEAALTGK